MTYIDLTPFGFTPTENLAYSALLEHGPSSGYALAKKLSIARANAYQALNGLAAKAAATTTDDRPQKFRPVRPEALLAHLTNIETEKLDLLEKQIRAAPRADSDSLVPIEGQRSLVTVATRTAAREAGPVICMGPAEVLQAVSPAWRRREADGLATELWTLAATDELPIEPAGVVNAERLAEVFPSQPFLFAGPETCLAATVDGDATRGYWISDPVLGSLVRGTIQALTR